MTVALVAPAFHFNATLLEEGRAHLHDQYGIRTVMREDIYDRDGYFAGDHGRRLQELTQWLTDDKVDGVIAVRGGYGCAHIYPALLKELKKKRALKPKILLGYSDLTIILNGLHQDLGWVTFHGPVVAGRPFREPLPIESETFHEALFSSKPLGSVTDPRCDVLSAGQARGPLVGGCLSLVVSSLGTPYEIETDGKVLFLEDVDERPYRLDRMMLQLVHAGKLDKVKALVFGQLVSCEPPTDKNKADGGPEATTAREAIVIACGDILKKRKIPALYDFPAGHGSPQVTFPIGARVEVRAAAGQAAVNFLEAGVK